MRVAVAGAGGYLGSFLCGKLAEEKKVSQVLKIGRGADDDCFLDLTEAERFGYEALDGIDIVLFLAAVSGPDQCALEAEKSRLINVTGTELFLREALNRNCRVLFFSSDAVFGDIDGMVYTELSETLGTTAYGRMKKTVEDKFMNNPQFKTLRLAYVVSEEDKFVSYCLKCMRDGKEADVFHPFYRNCITRSEVWQAVSWFLDHWDIYLPGMLNLAGAELVSRVRIADEINRMFGYRLKYTISRPADDFYRNRPMITQMKSLYLREYQILEDMSFTEKLQRELAGVRL
jgi:dTDP-4-dehydrorhamnose reductase